MESNFKTDIPRACPACLSPDYHSVVPPGKNNPVFQVVCTSCGTSGPNGANRYLAIRGWNALRYDSNSPRPDANIDADDDNDYNKVTEYEYSQYINRLIPDYFKTESGEFKFDIDKMAAMSWVAKWIYSHFDLRKRKHR